MCVDIPLIRLLRLAYKVEASDTILFRDFSVNLPLICGACARMAVRLVPWIDNGFALAPSTARPSAQSCVSTHTALASMRRCAGAPISVQNWSNSTATSPERLSPRTAQTQSCRPSRAATEESLQRRHHPYRHGAAGVHGAPGGPGAPAALTSDSLPWRFRSGNLASGRRLALNRVKCFGVLIQEFVLSLLAEILACLYLLQILRELAIPVRNVGGV